LTNYKLKGPGTKLHSRDNIDSKYNIDSKFNADSKDNINSSSESQSFCLLAQIKAELVSGQISTMANMVAKKKNSMEHSSNSQQPRSLVFYKFDSHRNF
jgi:hypothetical protein